MKSNREETNFTAEAFEALEKAGLSRRTFLKGTGAMIVGFSVAGAADVLSPESEGVISTAVAQSPATNRVDSWLAILPDGQILAYSGKSELGTGLFTAQSQLVAEMLDVPLSRVKLTICDTALCPSQGTTAGSQSHPTNFTTSNSSLISACLTARAELVKRAAAKFETTEDNLVVKDGVIIVKNDATKNVTYGELIGGGLFNVTPLNNAIPRKHPSTWKILGTSVPRMDLPDIVTGRLEYARDFRVPGMVYGVVVRPPVIDAKVISVDESSVSDIPGLIKVVVKNDFVGVVAEKRYNALRAAERLKVEWGGGLTLPANVPDFYKNLPSHADLYAWLVQQPRTNGKSVDSKDVDETLASATKVIEATYYHPYNMHGSLGASAAVADVQADRATVWSPTQGVQPLQAALVNVLGLPANNIRVIWKMGSGCYGLNGADAVSFDAAILSQAVGRPVFVQLSRKDEMAWENYGPAYVHKQRIGIDAQGNMIAWDQESWSSGKGGRPNATGGTLVSTATVGRPLPGFTPATGPANDPTNFGNGGNAVPSYMAGFVGGNRNWFGTIRSERVVTHSIRSPFWTGPLRAPARLQNTWSQESMIDEVAAHVNADPVEYRLRHIIDDDPLQTVSGTRLKDCIKAAAEKFGWDARPSPKGNSTTGVVTGRGIACMLYEGNNGYAAVIAEVEVNQETGLVKVTKITMASDSGPVSNPNGIANQNEGGALQGMSRALGEDVTWDNEKVTSIDWITYPTWKFSHGVPDMQNVLINRPDVAKAMGSGEVTVTAIAAAMGNAIFDATGARIRQLPFTPERVLDALKTRFRKAAQ
ncbi:MAG: xanthine dehydrogenase family protein molybdopterin-binding subunit [Acidobacteria bacterium]|nr:xanthine dehydrogenase family protein molybdopterin-binding subunit [Acidobacteriota bacterium]